MSSGAPRGQRDCSSLRISRHALERFIERFVGGSVTAGEAEARLRESLARTRRLGRNRVNGAVAVLALVGDRMMVAIVQGETCTTVLTWPQFEPRLSEFGRSRLPRKQGRMLRRLRAGRPDEPG